VVNVIHPCLGLKIHVGQTGMSDFGSTCHRQEVENEHENENCLGLKIHVGHTAHTRVWAQFVSQHVKRI
jgi:hypothetical protein